MRSRFNFGGSAGEIVKKMEANKTLDDRWLEEAANAFHVSVLEAGTRRTHIRRKQADVVEDVIASVQRSRRIVSGSAAEMDESRMRQLEASMASSAGKWAAAKNCYVSRAGHNTRQVKDKVILRSCPEELRLAVVSEFVARTSRLPMPDCEVEDTAWQYVSSAVGRRWNTTATGEQLTAQQVSAWNGVLSTVAESSRPAWQEDPLFLIAQQVYADHNTIVGFKAKKHDCSNEAELARGLVVLRKALYVMPQTVVASCCGASWQRRKWPNGMLIFQECGRSRALVVGTSPQIMFLASDTYGIKSRSCASHVAVTCVARTLIPRQI